MRVDTDPRLVDETGFPLGYEPESSGLRDEMVELNGIEPSAS